MRVIDKRMFNEDGELRDDVKKELAEFAARPAEPPPAAVPASAPVSAAQPKAAGGATAAAAVLDPDAPAAAEGPADPHFARLVITLSNQAGLLLGLLVDPMNPAGTVDPAAAKTFIDMLTVLEDKTRGNLNREEEQLIESVLYELKMAYVERTRRAPRP